MKANTEKDNRCKRCHLPAKEGVAITDRAYVVQNGKLTGEVIMGVPITGPAKLMKVSKCPRCGQSWLAEGQGWHPVDTEK